MEFENEMQAAQQFTYELLALLASKKIPAQLKFASVLALMGCAANEANIPVQDLKVHLESVLRNYSEMLDPLKKQD